MPDARTDCPFCAIVSGRAPARIVYRDAWVVAFFPDHPATLGHTLVVPREHSADILSAGEESSYRVLRAVREVGAAIQAALRPPGMNVISSVGAAASQTVYHLHVHLVPRWPGDSMGDIWPRRRLWAARDLDAAAGDVRNAISRDAAPSAPPRPAPPR